jgi:hypothetical protein
MNQQEAEPNAQNRNTPKILIESKKPGIKETNRCSLCKWGSLPAPERLLKTNHDISLYQN